MLTIRNALYLAVWAAALWASLRLANAPGDWGHPLCGVWGCGPPLQALVACHLGWLALLAPPAVLFFASNKISHTAKAWTGAGLAAAGLIMLLGVVAHEYVTWLPVADEQQQAYFLQRCVFVLATTFWLPVGQLLLIGVVGGLSCVRRAKQK